MADINLNIVGTADITQIRAAIQRLKTELASIQSQNILSGPKLLAGTREAISQFNALAEASGEFKVHTLEATTAADRLSERIRRNKTNYTDLRMALSSLNKEGSLFLQLGTKQQAILDAQAIKIGKTTYVYEALNTQVTAHTKAALINARAVAAQNAVLKEAAINIINTGKNAQWTGRQLTMGITMPIAMMGMQTARLFNEVDKNLTRLAKVYGVGLTQPTEKALKQIRKDVLDLANELGKTLGISAAEVSDIAAQFAAAGYQGKELVALTKQASRAVVLGEADKQDAISATISLQTAYKLNTEQVTEAINFFNAAQAATSTSMGDLINAIPKVGPIIKGLGGSYKDMVAILTALKEGGVPAAEAANAIKNSLGRIINPTEAAKKSLKGFGIDIESIVNKNAGNLSATLLELQKGLKNLDNLSKQRAISELFGKYQFARMAAFIENFNSAGSQSAKIMDMMAKSSIELANIADTQTKRMQQSASKRFEIASQSLKNALLPIGEWFLNFFSTVLDKATELVKTLQDLPAPIRTFMKIMGALVTGVGPMVMVAGLFGNMVGSLGKGIVTLKQWTGAIKSLFTGGGKEGFKIIMTGFKDTDLVATAATKAINVFNNDTKNTANAAKVFESGINVMIASLRELADQAQVARSIVTDVVNAPTATATGALPSEYARARFERSRLQGVSYHHLFGLSEQNRAYGRPETIQSGRSLQRPFEQVYGGISILPESMQGIAQTAAGTESLIYSNKAELMAVRDRIVKTLIQNKIQPEMIQKAVEALPMPLETYSFRASTMSSAFEAVGKLNKKLVTALNNQLLNIQKQYDAGTISIEEMGGKTLATLISAIKQSPEALVLFEQKLLEHQQAIINTYNTAGGGKRGALASQELIKDIEVAARAQAAKAGMTAVELGVKAGGAVRAAQIAISTQVVGNLEEFISALMTSSSPAEIEKALAAIKKSKKDLQSAVSKAAFNVSNQLEVMAGEVAAPMSTPFPPSTGKNGNNVDIEGRRTRNQRILRGVGTAGMIGSTAMMMTGTGNEWLNSGMMGISMGSMAATMLPETIGMGPAGLIIAAVSAVPLLIKYFGEASAAAEKYQKAAYAAFTTSAKEAELFGVKLKSLGEMSFKPLTEAAKAVEDSVSQMSDQIKALGEEDPLKVFADSLKDKTLEDRMSALQNKYLTYRLQGLTDQEAQNAVQAIMRAGGVEIATLANFRNQVASLKNLSPADMYAMQQKALAETVRTTPGGAQYTLTGTGYYDQKLKYTGLNLDNENVKNTITQNAETLMNLVNNSSYDTISAFSSLTNKFEKGSIQFDVFNETLKSLYSQMGDLGDQAFKKLTQDGVSLGDQLVLLKLASSGAISSMDQFNRAVNDVAYRTQVIGSARAVGAVGTAESAFKSAISKNATRQEYTTGGAAAAAAATSGLDKQITAQQSIVDKLQEELALRNKINDAQNKSLSYSNTMTSLQQQYNEALASNDMASAASLQRQMNAEIAKYNQELAVAAKQNELDAANKKLQDLQKQKQKTTDSITKSSKTVTTTIDQETTSLLAKIEEAIQGGTATDKQINIWANSLKNEFGGSAKVARQAIVDLKTSLEQTPEFMLGQKIADSLGKAIDQTQRAIIQTMTYKLLSEGKYATINEAAAAALSQATGSKVIYTGKEFQKETRAGGPRETKFTTIVDSSGNPIKPFTYASGGHIRGAGTGTSDSILARVSNGEFIMKANAVKAYGVDTLNAMNNSVPTFAEGGPVSTSNIPGFRRGGEVRQGVAGVEDRYLQNKWNKEFAMFWRALPKGKDGRPVRYEGVTGNMKPVPMTNQEINQRIEDFMYASEVGSQIRKLGFGGLASGMWESFKKDPLDTFREMSGISSINRLLFNSYSNDAAGRAQRGSDVLVPLMSLIPGMGLAGTGARAGMMGARAGMRGARLATSVAGAMWKTTGTKAMLDLGKFGITKGYKYATPITAAYLAHKFQNPAILQMALIPGFKSLKRLPSASIVEKSLQDARLQSLLERVSIGTLKLRDADKQIMSVFGRNAIPLDAKTIYRGDLINERIPNVGETAHIGPEAFSTSEDIAYNFADLHAKKEFHVENRKLYSDSLKKNNEQIKGFQKLIADIKSAKGIDEKLKLMRDSGYLDFDPKLSMHKNPETGEVFPSYEDYGADLFGNIQAAKFNFNVNPSAKRGIISDSNSMKPGTTMPYEELENIVLSQIMSEKAWAFNRAKNDRALLLGASGNKVLYIVDGVEGTPVIDMQKQQQAALAAQAGKYTKEKTYGEAQVNPLGGLNFRVTKVSEPDKNGVVRIYGTKLYEQKGKKLSLLPFEGMSKMQALQALKTYKTDMKNFDFSLIPGIKKVLGMTPKDTRFLRRVTTTKNIGGEILDPEIVKLIEKYDVEGLNALAGREFNIRDASFGQKDFAPYETGFGKIDYKDAQLGTNKRVFLEFKNTRESMVHENLAPTNRYKNEQALLGGSDFAKKLIKAELVDPTHFPGYGKVLKLTFEDSETLAKDLKSGPWNLPFAKNDPALQHIKQWTGGNMSAFRKRIFVPGKGWIDNPKVSLSGIKALNSIMRPLPSGLHLSRRTILNPGVSGEMSSEIALAIINAIRTGDDSALKGTNIKFNDLASFTTLDPITGRSGVMGNKRFAMINEPIGAGTLAREIAGLKMHQTPRTGLGRVVTDFSGKPIGKHGFEDVEFVLTTSGGELGRDISASMTRGGQTHLDEILTRGLSAEYQGIERAADGHYVVYLGKPENSKLLKDFLGTESKIGGARKPATPRTATTKGKRPSARLVQGLNELVVPYHYLRYGRQSGDTLIKQLTSYGAKIYRQGEGKVLGHMYTPGFRQLVSGNQKMAGSSPLMDTKTLRQMGLSVRGSSSEVAILPSQILNIGEAFNKKISRAGATAGDWTPVGSEDFISLLYLLMQNKIPQNKALEIATVAANHLNNAVPKFKGKILENDMGSLYYNSVLKALGSAKFNNGGLINLPKYHTGGYVNYKYGGEVAAMLQGGEVVIPKEVVRDLATNNSSVYNNNPNITINVAGTNASAQEIANAVTHAMQTRANMDKSRTVVRV